MASQRGSPGSPAPPRRACSLPRPVPRAGTSRRRGGSPRPVCVARSTPAGAPTNCARARRGLRASAAATAGLPAHPRRPPAWERPGPRLPVERHRLRGGDHRDPAHPLAAHAPPQPARPPALTSSFELDEVLARLRAAGFAPMPEDADGVAIVAEWGGGPAPTAAPSKPRARARVAAADLATRLLADGNAPDHPISATHAQLAELAPRLDAVEVALLAGAPD